MKNFFSLAAGLAIACLLLLKASSWLQPSGSLPPLPGLEFPAGLLQNAIRCCPFG